MNPIEILQQHKIKKTSPRVAIIQALQRSDSPLTESEIKEKMGDYYDRITFYRNMQSMSDAGILHRIIIDNTLIKYALNPCRKGDCFHENHAHFICQRCNNLICLEEINFTISLPKGFMQKKVDLLIHGVCGKCNTGNE